MTEVAETARSLTKAQRKAVGWGGSRIGIIASNAQLADRLIGKGLAIRTRASNHSRMLDWTERGLAVRDYLKEQGND